MSGSFFRIVRTYLAPGMIFEVEKKWFKHIYIRGGVVIITLCDNVSDFPGQTRVLKIKMKAKNLRNASPGPDNIHASMLKHLHSNTFDYLLSLFNTILLQRSYPRCWKLTISLPILEPSKDLSLPSSYRPIATRQTLPKNSQ